MRNYGKAAAIVLAAVMLLSSFGGCQEQEAAQPGQQAEQTGCRVTLRVDGKEYVVLDGTGMTVQQLLEQAGVSLEPGDTLSIDPSYMLGGQLTVQLVRGREQSEQTEQPDNTEATETQAPTAATGSSGGSYQPTEPKPTEPQKTVVSVQIYEDCDGSGHGVKVITYSDGTQEEVPF